MSSPAAIAAVTAVLKDLLDNGLIDRGAVNVVGNVTVTAQAPDRIPIPEQQSQLNLFLYLVTPNQGWRNADQPARDSHGDLINPPTLALDLHYLVSAYGAKDFHAEILLGYAMQLLHEMPVLSRAAIRLALQPSTPVINGGQLPPDLQDLAVSGLADQIEMIKITPTYLTTEEMFKLWMAFQAPYRPTAGYHVSVVLIESKHKGKSALPVRERVVTAIPFRQPVVQTLLSQAPSPPNAPFLPDQPILTGYRLALVGRQLKGEKTQVLLDGEELPAAQVQVGDTRIVVTLPAGLPAGVHTLQVAQQVSLGIPPSPHRGSESQLVPFVLAPTVTATSANVTAGTGTDPRTGTVTVTVAPQVGPDQRVTLLLNELSAPTTRPAWAYRLEAPAHRPGPSATIDIAFDGVLPVTYLVRVQIDGAESPLAMSSAGLYTPPPLGIS
jgi:hypothetical protein